MCSILTSTLALFRIPSISRSVQHSVSFSKISRTSCYSRRQFSLLNGPKGDSDLGVSTATSIIKNNGASFVKNLLKMLAIVPVVVATAANADEATEATSFTNLDSGLKYRDLKVGEGAVPVPGDTVRVHYTGWLDGFDSSKKFDSSYDRRSPLVFKVGVRQVIAGMSYTHGVFAKRFWYRLIKIYVRASSRLG